MRYGNGTAQRSYALQEICAKGAARTLSAFGRVPIGRAFGAPFLFSKNYNNSPPCVLRQFFDNH